MPRTLVDLTTPLPLRAALAAFVAYAEEHRTQLTKATQDGIVSTVIGAVRHWRRPRAAGADAPAAAEVLEADIRPVLRDLGTYAHELAVTKRHQKPRDHRRRAERFVEVLIGTGGRGCNAVVPCGPAWQPLLDADSRPNARSTYHLLERCCQHLGVHDAPARLPAYDDFMSAATALGTTRDTVRTAMSRYRKHLDRARELYPCAALATMPNGRIGRATHLGVEQETLDALRSAGVPEPERLTPQQMLEHIAPELAADIEYAHSAAANGDFSDSWKDQCWQMAARVVGWLVRAGRLQDAQSLQLLDLLLVTVDAGPQRLNPRAARAAARHGVGLLEPAAACDEAAGDGRDAPATMSLLEFLLEREAAASIQRSPVVSQALKTEACGWADLPTHERRRKIAFTLALYQNAVKVWSLIEAVHGDLRHSKPDLWALLTMRWTALKDRLILAKVPDEHCVNAKDKALLIKTLTLPQLVCVAMPYRLRRIRRLREQWLAVRADAQAKGHASPDGHPAVTAALEAYFDLALPFLMVSLAVDDGLRKKQYQEGRFGSTRNFRVAFRFDTEGRPVGIESLTTWWSGDKADPAHLKIRRRKGRLAQRDGRDVRPGYVPFDLLFDYLMCWRPLLLLRGGAIKALADYDVAVDMRDGKWALFVSPDRGVVERRVHRSRTDFEQIVGPELHAMTRESLRPDLPPWAELGPKWRSLWTQHAFRLLNGSFWGGVRGDWTTACYLTQDKEQTLKDEYSEVDAAMRDRLLRDPSNWEHPHAYDDWMDRLFGRREVFDPLDDPALPLPPQLAAEREATAVLLNTAGRGDLTRVRRARPGQPAPHLPRAQAAVPARPG